MPDTNSKSSATFNTQTGSGSRPNAKSKFSTPTSAPAQPHTLGRDVPGALGMGKRVEDVR